MDLLVPDPRSATTAALVGALEAEGHRVHVCLEDDADEPCRQVVAGDCPLDTAPIDVAVAVGPPPESELADGAVCAIRRRIPLVLVDVPASHPLAPWATARCAIEEAVRTVDEVMLRPLQAHGSAARRALLHELRRQGSSSATADVDVVRQPGRLLVTLRHDPAISRTQAERLATHVAQAVRAYDRWAPKLDVTVVARPDGKRVVVAS